MPRKIDDEVLRKNWGKVPQKELATQFGVSPNSISKRGKTLGLVKKEKRIQAGIKQEITKRIFRGAKEWFAQGLEARKEIAELAAVLKSLLKHNKEIFQDVPTARRQKSILETADRLLRTFEAYQKMERELREDAHLMVLQQALYRLLDKVDPKLRFMLIDEIGNLPEHIRAVAASWEEIPTANLRENSNVAGSES